MARSSGGLRSEIDSWNINAPGGCLTSPLMNFFICIAQTILKMIKSELYLPKIMNSLLDQMD